MWESLFYTYDMSTGNIYSDPPTNSLFNLDNMKQLVSLGQSTPNICFTN